MGSLTPLNLIRGGNRSIELREARVIMEAICGTEASILLPLGKGLLCILNAALGLRVWIECGFLTQWDEIVMGLADRNGK